MDSLERARCIVNNAPRPSCCCCFGPTGPTGAIGPIGIADTITISTTTTGEPGTSATVTDVAETPNHVLEFVIPRGATGPTGPIGSTGPSGSMTDTATCFCVNQLRNIIEQLIELYPEDDLIVRTENGNTITGRPGSIFNNNTDGGLFLLENNEGVVTGAIAINRIVSISIINSTYNDTISYLEPSVAFSGCDADCESSVRAYLPIGTANVSIQSGPFTVASGNVLINNPGIVVLTDINQSNPVFVSPCKIEIINL